MDGAGIARLRAAGIEVEKGVLHDEADEVAAGFRSRVRLGRPSATLAAAARQIAACGKIIWLWACILKLRIFAAAALLGPAGPAYGPYALGMLDPPGRGGQAAGDASF